LGVDRTRPRYKDQGLGRVDGGEQEDPRQAEQGVLEAEEREKGFDSGIHPSAEKH